MQVSCCVLTVVVVTITFTFAAEINKHGLEVKSSSQPNLEDAKIQALDDISPASQASRDIEVRRKKKSATTTTFCVEIRPSDPYQKPFQVCEPSESAKPATYPVSDGNYYAAPSYSEQPKTQAQYQPASNLPYKPVTQPKPAPAYSAPVKTFSAPSIASHPSTSYSSYRSKNAEGALQEHSHDHMMRMTETSEEEDDQSSESLSNRMRSASYGSASYGAPTSFIPVVPKHKHKQHGHNGLVITCQPNLAGYAHNIPSSFHHPAPVSYSYRSSGPRNYGGRGYGRYKIPTQSYGNVHQGPVVGPGPALKPSATVSAGPMSKLLPSPQSYGSVYKPQVYQPPVPQYSPPSYKPSPVYSPQVPLSPPSSYAQPPPPPPSSAYSPLPVHPQPLPSASASYASPQSYAAYSQVHAPPPPALAPVSAPAAYGPPPPPPVVPPPAPPTLPVPPAPPAPPAYVPPTTYYRESENDNKIPPSKATSHQMEKEGQTLKKMQELSVQRAAGGQWKSEISTDKSQQEKADEHVQESPQGWSARSSLASGDMEGLKHAEAEQEPKNNEVDHQA